MSAPLPDPAAIEAANARSSVMKRVALLVLVWCAFFVASAFGQSDILPQQVQQQVNQFGSELAQCKQQYESVASQIVQVANVADNLQIVPNTFHPTPTYKTTVETAAALLAATPNDLSVQVMKSQADSCAASATALNAEIQGVAQVVAIIQDKGVTACLVALQAALYPNNAPMPAYRSINPARGFHGPHVATVTK